MMTSTPDYRGIPVYEDATMPHRDPETGKPIHARLVTLPGRGTMLLCSSQFFLELKERHGG